MGRQKREIDEGGRRKKDTAGVAEGDGGKWETEIDIAGPEGKRE